jgi:hypothetical protein
MGAYGDGELVSALGRLWTTYAGDDSRPHRAGCRAPGSFPCFSQMDGKLIPRHFSKSWASCIVPGVVGTWGASRSPRLVAPKSLFYTQGVKVRNKTGQVVEVSRRVVYGGPRGFSKQLRLRQLGRTIQTAFMDDGMAPCEGWWPPYDAAPGVCRGAAPATGGRSGCWSVSTIS